MAEPTDWSKYEGKTGTYNGQRIIVRGGVPVPLTRFQPSATHPQPVEDALAAQRAAALTSRQVRSMGDQFQQANLLAGTGGLGTALGGEGSIFGVSIPGLDRRPERQAMEGLSSKMLSALTLPGASKSMDSNAEMKMALSRLPSVYAQGPVNTERVAELQRNEAIQQARLVAMESWAGTHQSMDGFESAWAPQEAKIRRAYKFQPPPRLPANAFRKRQAPKRPPNVPKEAQWDGSAWVLP